MVDRLKGTLKADLAALRGVDETDVVGPKKTPTPRKRKAKGEAGAEGEATPTKRGRKKKVTEEVVAEEDEELTPVKPEPKDEDLEEDV